MYKCPADGYILAEKYILCRTYAPKYIMLAFFTYKQQCYVQMPGWWLHFSRKIYLV